LEDDEGGIIWTGSSRKTSFLDKSKLQKLEIML